MDDPRLEARLRDDPTGDPAWIPGGFRDRTIGVGVEKPRSMAIRGLGVGPSFSGALLAVIVIALALAFVGGGVGGPRPTPTPAPSPTLSIDEARLRSTIAEWSAANGSPGFSITVIRSRGELVTLTGPEGSAMSELSTVRIGEVSRIFVLEAVVGLDECRRGVGSLSCPPPIRGGLSLDDPVIRWVPDWPPADATTVRQLVEGSSGLAPIAATIVDLRHRMVAAPAAEWSRATLLARAIAEPRRFTAGSERSPVDTELTVLEAVIAAATGRPAGVVIGDITGHGRGKLGFLPSLEAPRNIVPGTTTSGGQLSDLEPAVIAVLGDQGGIAASSQDLAHLGLNVWRSTIAHDTSTIGYLVDEANGRQEPIGGRGTCPCNGDERFVVVQTGHAVGWSAFTALDAELNVSIGVVLDHDLDDRALDDLLQRLEAALRS